MLESHLVSMMIFAALVSVMMACLRHDAVRDIVRHAGRNFVMLTGTVIVISWIMRIV